MNIYDYRSPLPKMPLKEVLSITTPGAFIGVLSCFPFLNAALTAKATNVPYIESLTNLFHETTKKPIRTMYGRFPWSIIREAQWITKYPLINWVNQKLTPHVSNSHFRLFVASTLVAMQEWGCYGIGDYLYISHATFKANNWTVSTKEHLSRAFRSKRMGGILYIATNTIWQFVTMDGISIFQQSLPGRVKKSVPKKILLPISIFFPTLLATIAMVPFNAFKTIAQTSSKNKVLGIFEAVNTLNLRRIYRGTWPMIFFATLKITAGVTFATIYGNKISNQKSMIEIDD